MRDDITVTKVDYERLNSLILRLLDDKGQDIRKLNFLNIEIKRAKKIDPRKITSDFVTMNSVLAVTFLDTGKSMTLKLVFPDKSNYKEGLISVLSPLGCALLGYKAGDLVTYRTSEVNQIVRIDKIIYQPEAYGEDLILA